MERSDFISYDLEKMITANQVPTVDAVASHYDELDRFYRAIWGEHIHHGIWITGKETQQQAVRKTIDLVAKKAEITTDSLVCDVGCGYGGTARVLVQEYGAKVTGFTVSQAQMDYALSVRKNPDNPKIFQMDWMQNQLPESAFDSVIAIESSEHMADKSKFFSECFRVLKPGGGLVICAWLSKENPSPWERKYLLEPICTEGRIPSLGSMSDYKNFYTESGFRFADCEDYSQNVKKTWSLTILGTAKHLLTKPKDLAYLLDGNKLNREFALTQFRLRLAFETGAMRYGIFKGTKSG